MNSTAIANLALIFATQARIEGMKAENQQRISNGDKVAYGEDAFNNEAAGLDALARDTREWGWQT